MDKRTLEIAAFYLSQRWPYDWNHAQKTVCKYIMGIYDDGNEFGLETIIWC